MKKNLLFIGIIFLGLSMIISSYIISKSLSKSINMNGILNGSLTVSDMDSYNFESDVLQAFNAGRMLGYEADSFIQDINNGKLDGIPYIKLEDHYIFSKKALEEWVYNESLK